MKPLRVKNAATAKDVAKVIRCNLQQFDERWKTQDLDNFIEDRAELLTDLVRCAGRPNASLIKQALSMCWSHVDPHEAKAFGEKVCNSVSLARTKSRSVTSGKKLGKGMNSLVALMKKKQSLGESLLQRSKELHRSRALSQSDGSSDSEVLVTASSSSTSGHSQNRISRAEVFASFGLQPDMSALPDTAERMAALSQSVVVIEESPCKTSNVTVVLEYMDTAKQCLVRTLSNGAIVSARMEAGASGFAEAFFPGEDKGITTEMPNLLLNLPARATAVRKRPSACLKKPASAKVQGPIEASDSDGAGEEGAGHAEENAEVREEEAVPPASPARFVSAPYQYKNGAWGIRDLKGSKRQFFQLNSRTKSSDDVKAVTLQCKTKLAAGEDVLTVKAWGMSQL